MNNEYMSIDEDDDIFDLEGYIPTTPTQVIHDINNKPGEKEKMTIAECLEKLPEAFDNFRANECHCVNVRGRDLTESELSAWEYATKNYRHWLIQTIDVLVDELKEVENV